MASKTENRRINIYINGKAVENSGKAIRSEFSKARAELNKTNKAAGDYQQKLKRFNEAKKHLQKHNDELRGVSKSWLQFKTIAGGIIGANVIQGALRKLGGFVKGLIVNNAKLSDSFADVMKTTGLTNESVSELYDEFKSFNTRTPRSELLKLAKEAGRLGIKGKDNIKSFVEQANMIEVALGEDLGDDAVLQIGKIADAFNTSMTKIGSAINETGANSKAQEQYLVDFTARLQGTAKAADIAAGDVLGYGAVLDSLGLQAEKSGTAVNTVFLEMISDTSKFETAAGMAKGELASLIGEKGANEGLIYFIDTLKQSSNSTQEFVSKLQGAIGTSARKTEVMLALSGNLDKVRKMQTLANGAFEKGTSLTDEYNIKNENLAANLDKIKNYLTEAFVNGAIMKGISKMVSLFSDWIEIPVSETLQKELVSLGQLELKIYDVNTPTEDRVKLIKELQEQYPDFLSNIDAETISNEDLHKELKKVNQMLVAKIVIQKKQEQIDETNEEAAERIIELEEKKQKIREKLVKYSKDNNIELLGADGKGQYSLLEKVNDLQEKMNASNDRYMKSNATYVASLGQDAIAIQEEINELNKEALDLTDERNRLAEELGLNDTGPKSIKTDDDSNKPLINPDSEGLTDKEKKALKKKHEEFLKAEAKLQKALEDLRVKRIDDEEQREIDKAALDYQRRQKEIEDSVASEATKNELLVEEKIAFNNKIDEITEEFRLKREEKEKELKEKEAEEKLLLSESLMNDRELELSQLDARYEILFALAEKHGADMNALVAKKRKEQAEINGYYDEIDAESVKNSLIKRLQITEEKWAATADISASSIATINSMMNLLGKSAENMSDFQAAMALFQIGVDTAKGLSTAAVISVDKGPIAGAVYYAATVAQLFTNMAAAKQQLSSSNKPEYKETRSTPRYRRGARFRGVSHDSVYGGNPIIDPRDNSVLGTIEKNETLLSEATGINNAGVVNALLESSMRGGGEVDLLPYALAQNQAEMDFEGLSGGGSSVGGVKNDDMVAMIAAAMNPALDEIRRIKQQPSVVKLSQLKDAERELNAVQYLSGKKFN